MLRLSLLAILLLTAFTGCSGEKTARVEAVIDGDTIIIDGGDIVRLIGIDSPEREEKYYYEAKDKLASLVMYETVRLEKDEEDRDDYGRLLRYVYLEDGLFVNKEMVASGYATSYPYPPNIEYAWTFYNAEKAARDSYVGMWEDDEPAFNPPKLNIDTPSRPDLSFDAPALKYLKRSNPFLIRFEL